MKRTKGPQRLGEILRDFLETSGLAQQLKHLEVYSAWEEVAGPALCRYCRIAGFARHKLHVDVASAAHLHELRTFYKGTLLVELNQRLPGLLIQDIVFRPASIPRS